MSVYFWFYLATFGLALTVPLGLYLYREFRVDATDAGDSPEPSSEPEPPAELAGAGSGQGESAFESVEQTFFSTDEWGDASSSTGTVLRQGAARRLCPECGEQFPTTVVVCPHDSTPLEDIDQSGEPASDETILERQRCPGCGRRYEPGPAYCYHDGMRLRHDTSEDAEDAPVFKVCRTCGWEGQLESRTCPKDGGELTVVDPSQESRISPPLPVLYCPECGEYAEPGRARCPDDETVLTPLENSHTTALPARGLGPRRKICQECGESYSSAGRYCTDDGSELMPMN